MHEAEASQQQHEALQELRRRLAAGEITPEQAKAQGFPPADPIKERR